MRHRWIAIGAGLISLGWLSTGSAQAQGVCDRTPQVRDKLMERVGVKDCAAVTAGQLAGVEGLSLWESGLTSLQVHDFRGLVALRWLYLNDNDLRELPAGVFRDLTGLKRLGLWNNRLETLPEGIFEDLTGLEELRLDHNLLEALPKGAFRGLERLEWLWLNHNLLEALPERAFDGLAGLRELRLHSNLLRELPAGIFDDLLDTLVTSLPDYGLTVPRHLRAGLAFAASASEGEPGSTVRVAVRLTQPLPVAVRAPFTVEGEAGSVRPDPRAGLVILAGETRAEIEMRLPAGGGSVGKRIELRLGETDQIGLRRSDGSGPDAPHLHTGVLLELDWKRAGHTVTTVREIERKPPFPTGGICDRTPRVRDKLMEILEAEDCAAVTAADLATVRGGLNLEEPGLASLKAHDFQGLANLKRLYLDENWLEALPEEIFRDLTSLKRLYLHHNQLKSLPSGVFDGLERLEELFLSDNLLTELPEGVFRDLTGLKRLWLDDNHLRTLPSGVFDGLERLEELFLGDNLLTELPEGVFRDLTGLKRLALYSNQLRELPDGVFDGMTRIEELLLGFNRLEALPGGVFGGMAELKRLWLLGNDLKVLPRGIFEGLTLMRALLLDRNRLRELPAGVFDDPLPTLGGKYLIADVFIFRGQLWVDTHLMAHLELASEEQRASPGAEVRVGVALSRPLPVAVRVPFELGVGGSLGGLSGLEPAPEEGLLFRAGETEKSIVFRVEEGGAGEGTVTVTLGLPDEIGLRRSDGSGPDAPYLATDSLVLRHQDRLVHTVRVSGGGEGEREREPYCLSLWEGAGCAAAGTLPYLRLGRWGEGEATAEVVLTHLDPATEGCEAALVFHRGSEPAPPVAFDGHYPEGNRLRLRIPRGGARVLQLTAPGGEAVEGAATLFTRSPCTPGSLRLAGRSLLYDGTGEIEEMVTMEGVRPGEALGNGECRRLTGFFGPEEGLRLVVAGAEPGRAAPPGTRLEFRAFDREGRGLGPLPDAALDGSQQWLPPWPLEGLATIETCLEAPGESGFRLAVSPFEVRAGSSGIQQQAPGAFAPGR